MTRVLAAAAAKVMSGFGEAVLAFSLTFGWDTDDGEMAISLCRVVICYQSREIKGLRMAMEVVVTRVECGNRERRDVAPFKCGTAACARLWEHLAK